MDNVKSVGEMTVQQLRQFYPNGFVISASGTVDEVIAASSHLVNIARAYPLPPEDGGYIVVQAGKKHMEALRDDQTR